MFSITNDLGQPKMTVNFNTDSIFDLMTGSAVVGADGKWYINGGFGPATSGVNGRAQTFKSTIAASLAMRLSAVYDSQLIVFDSEDALTRDLPRMVRMAGDHASQVTTDYIAVLDAKTKYDVESMRDMIHDLGEKKKALGKDAYITTPFIEPRTGEQIKVFRPSCIMIDSYSECFTKEEDTFVSEKGLDDPRARTLYMADANKKTSCLRNLSRYAAEYGIELVLTAHYGSKIGMDTYTPQPKYVQWASQNDSPKNVGSKWAFLTSPMLLTNGVTKLMDDAKQCKYQLTRNTSPTELSEVTVLMQRCKNNSSGLQHPFVVSQENGILTDASDYNFLRANKGFAFNGNNVTHQCMFYPEVSMTRNSFRGICQKDHKLTRALQLAAQLLYIQLNWSDANWSFPIKVDPKALVDALYSDKNKMSVDRVLNSRSYWLPEEIKDEREYMSIFDVLQFVNQCSLVKT